MKELKILKVVEKKRENEKNYSNCAGGGSCQSCGGGHCGSCGGGKCSGHSN